MPEFIPSPNQAQFTAEYTLYKSGISATLHAMPPLDGEQLEAARELIPAGIVNIADVDIIDETTGIVTPATRVELHAPFKLEWDETYDSGHYPSNKPEAAARLSASIGAIAAIALTSNMPHNRTN